jgi:hypothetical protein
VHTASGLGIITVTYPDGTADEGVLMARYGNTVRVAMRDCDDISQFTCLNGTWLSEACEPVRIDFEEHGAAERLVSEVDYSYSKELEALLIHVLLSRDDGECADGKFFEIAPQPLCSSPGPIRLYDHLLRPQSVRRPS